jgi:hypothetical protein
MLSPVSPKWAINGERKATARKNQTNWRLLGDGDILTVSILLVKLEKVALKS